jgi:hypothetical protein
VVGLAAGTADTGAGVTIYHHAHKTTVIADGDTHLHG